jgi:uncharacterized protein YajQ (UPF0234 family)
MTKTENEVFDRLHPDDKRALKRFMTGQIQNILANEYGIGGTKTLKGQVEQAIAEEVQRQINRLMDGDRLIETIADRLVATYHRQRGKAQEELKNAIREETRKAIADIVGEAAGRVQINLSIAQAPTREPTDQNPNFGRF